MKNYKIFILGFISAAISLLSIFAPLANRAMKNEIWITFINFPALILFWLIMTIFALIYAKAFRQPFKKTLYCLFFSVIISSLFFNLAKLKIAFNSNDPFSGAFLFSLYARTYFYGVIALSGIIMGRFLLRLMQRGINDHKICFFIFYFPIFILSIYSSLLLILAKDYLSFILIVTAFFTSYFIKGNIFARFKKPVSLATGFFRRNSVCVLVIFLLAFAIRYFWGLRIISILGADFPLASDDGDTYTLFASILAKGGQIPAEKGLYWAGIGYWYFLSLLHRLFGGNNYKAFVLIQALLGSLVPVSIFYIASWLFNRSVGIMVAILSILSVNLIFLSVVIGMEALFIPLLCITMALFIKLILDKKIKRGFYPLLVGFLFGLVFCARQEILVFFLALPVLMLIFLKKRFSKGQIARISLLMVIGASIPLLFIASHNYINFGRFTFFTRNVSSTFAKPYYGSTESMVLDQIGFNPFSNISASLQAFFSDPLKISGLLIKSFFKKGVRYLFFPNFGWLDPFIIVNPIFYFSKYAVLLSFYSILFLIFGAISSLREKKNRFAPIFIIGYMTCTFFIYALVKASNARHRGVLEPFFLMFISYGFYKCYRWFRDENSV